MSDRLATGGDPSRLFSFVQFEFPWALGPPDGRYVLRGPADDGPRGVLVLSTLGAPERRTLLGRRRGREAPEEPEPTPVVTARATVIVAEPLDGQEDGIRHTKSAGEPEAQAALRELATAIAAHRLAATDPHVVEPALEQALVVRVGYGSGEEVAEGQYTSARELPAIRRRRRKRADVLRPQERFAALLGGREQPLACEELALRARVDLDAGRLREAALQLRIALDAALAEFPGDLRGDRAAERLSELRELHEGTTEAAQAALTAQPSDAEAISAPLERLEAALRARSVAGG
ncbi:MAG: hypothetical protein ACR2K9_05100 [Solirubrobacteraceae bacterium]